MSFTSFDLTPLAGRMGAEILGINLSADLTDPLIQDIRQALIQYKVIFFRQQSLDAAGQIAFARRFGEITAAHPTLPPLIEQSIQHREILDLDYGRTATRSNEWHTDVTFVDRIALRRSRSGKPIARRSALFYAQSRFRLWEEIRFGQTRSLPIRIYPPISATLPIASGQSIAMCMTMLKLQLLPPQP